MDFSGHRFTQAPPPATAMPSPPPFRNEQQQYKSTIDPHQPPPFKKPRNFIQDPKLLVRHNGASHKYFKTRPCIKFRMGQCPNGEYCNYAHGDDDMRQEQNDNNNASAGNWDDDERIIHKMRICRKFYNGGQCPFGDRCNFLHEDPKKFRDIVSAPFRESSAISVAGVSGYPNVPDQYDIKVANQSLMDPYRAHMKTVYWKTKICCSFESTGQCIFADKCHFAHGLEELRQHGGRIVGEMIPAARGITSSIPIIPSALNDQPSSNTTSTELAPVQDGGSDHRKRLLISKGLEKINRIYADWIDDLPQPAS